MTDSNPSSKTENYPKDDTVSNLEICHEATMIENFQIYERHVAHNISLRLVNNRCNISITLYVILSKYR